MNQLMRGEQELHGYGPLNPDLEFMLGLVAEALQLSATQRRLAEERYGGISSWLARDDSPLAALRPRLYPQGSMALGTTVRPRKSVEYDLDIVCEVEDAGRPAPELYDDVYKRLHANPAYRGILKRKNRCVCLEYANDFHLDLIPAVPDRSRAGTSISVPDRKLKDWTPSNPKGFVRWFEARSRGLVVRADSAEPLPPRLPTALTPALVVAVQLIKRRRDMIFDGHDDAPRSIILTTLAGTHYSGTTSVVAAIGEFAAAVEWTIRQHAPAQIEVVNPTNQDEKFTDGMTRERYAALTAFVQTLREDIAELARTEGVADFQKLLVRMFGEPVFGVVTTYADRLRKARESGTLGFSGGTPKRGGHLGIVTAAAEEHRVPRHRYYGA